MIPKPVSSVNQSRRLRVESLEDRCNPSTFTVDSFTDELDGNFTPGDLCLREAVQLANQDPIPDVIRFSSALAGQNLALLLGNLDINTWMSFEHDDFVNKQITIVGVSERIFTIGNSLQVTIKGLTLANGISTSGGGAILVGTDSLLNLTSCVFTGNRAVGSASGPGAGGAIFNRGAVIAENCSFYGNLVTGENGQNGSSTGGGGGGGGGAGAGGAIYNAGTAVFTSTTFASNVAIGGGGGAGFENGGESSGAGGRGGNSNVPGGSPGAAGSSGQVLQGGGGGGGGGGSASTGGTGGAGGFGAGGGGGGAATAGGGGSGFGGLGGFGGGNGGQAHSSAAAGGGGGAGMGGAIFNANGKTFTLFNCTVADNVTIKGVGGPGPYGSIDRGADGQSLGGGVFNSPGGTLNLRNTLLANNTADQGPDFHGAATTFTRNLVAKTSGSTGFGTDDLRNVAPVLYPATNLGYAVFVAPRPNSPAIDAGTSTLSGLDPRQLNFSRVADGDGNGTATIDIGAVEAAPVRTFVVTEPADQLDGDYTANDLSLREAVTLANAIPGPDTITFSPAFAGSGVSLSRGELRVVDDLTIDGDTLGVTIDGLDSSRLFYIDDRLTASRSVTLNNLNLTRGRAFDSDGGGAIYNEENLTINGSSLYLNRSVTGAGGAVRHAGPGALTVNNSTLTANAAKRMGGAVASDGPGVIRSSSVIYNLSDSDNTASASNIGGGLASSGGMTLHNSIVAGNFRGLSTPHDLSRHDSGTITAASTLIADAGTAAGLANDVSGNIVGVNGSGTRPLNTIVNFTLANNGGPTLTHALADNSPALNAGNNTLAVSGGDQRGLPRISDGTIDMGAVEKHLFAGPYVVDSPDDAAPGDYSAGNLSLREAVLLANNTAGFETIIFAPSLARQTLTLQRGEIPITTGLRIDGGTGGVTVSGNNASRIFTIDDNNSARQTVELANLNLTAGNGAGRTVNGEGGAILNHETLTVTGSTFHGNTSPSYGGAIRHVDGDLTVRRSTFSGNSAAAAGGAVYNSSTMLLTLSTVTGNRSDSLGASVNSVAIATYNDSPTTSTLLFGTIVAGNVTGTGNTPGDVGEKNVAATSGNNLIGDAGTAGGLVNGVNGNLVGVDALLEPLRDNGGPTLTRLPLPNSPAVNGLVNPVFNTFPDRLDQRGLRRGPDVFDIGSVELKPSYADDFDRANASALGLPWKTLGGSFKVLNNTAAPSTGTNLTVLDGLQTPDADLTATLSAGLGGLNSAIGLVARHNGVGNRNYYLAYLKLTSTGVVAGISRNVNGVTTVLASVPVNDSTGHLWFRVTGNTLSLHFKGALLLTATDSSFVTGGVGMFSSRGGFADTFRVHEIRRPVTGTDNFNAADNTTLRDPWTQAAGGFRTLANLLAGTAPVNVAVQPGLRPADVDLSATVNVQTLNNPAGLIARYSGVGDRNYYLGQVTSTAKGYFAQIVRNLNGKSVVLKSVAVNSGSGTLRFIVSGNSQRLFRDDVELLQAFDATLKTGSVGIRAAGTATLDDFQATPITTALPFADSFTRENNSPLSTTWATRVGGFKVSANQATGVATASNVATLVDTNLTDAKVQADVTVTTLNQRAGVIARYSGPAERNFYLGEIISTKTGYVARIVRNLNGKVAVLKSASVLNGTGTLQLKTTGTLLELSFAGNVVASATDVSLVRGSAGIRTSGLATMDEFSVTAPAVNLPFADQFSGADGPLAASWHTRAGVYQKLGEQAAGKSPVNVAVLADAPVRDVGMSFTVNVPVTLNASASLVARYNGPGDANMYLATIKRLKTGWVASIERKIGTVITTLATANVATGTGLLEFNVVGTELKLSFAGTPLLTATDYTLADGLVGIRASAKVPIDNFYVDRAN